MISSYFKPRKASLNLRRDISLVAVLFLLLSSHSPLHAAPREHWTAEWISHPTAPLREPGVFHFRKILHLDAKAGHFLVDVSADNHFLLYVNGLRIGEGPAKGDLQHWRYETFDLAPALHAGDNVIAATVSNFGIYAPLAVISERTAFLMQGDSDAESAVDTNATWQVEQEAGEAFIPRMGNGFMFYWAADPGERLDAPLYDWGWKDAGSSAELALGFRCGRYAGNNLSQGQRRCSARPRLSQPVGPGSG